MRWSHLKNPWVVAGMLLSGIVIIGLGLFALQVRTYIRSIKAGNPDPFQQKVIEASVTNLLTSMPVTSVDLSRIESKEGDPMLGNPEAKIHIVEFIDYQCPFSARSASAIRSFMSRHANDALLILRDYPLDSIHPQARGASIAARCIFSQGKAEMFWRYHDLLFSHQDALEARDLRTYAATVNADLPAFDGCIAARAPEGRIDVSIQDGTAAGVRGTPTFFFNGIRVQGSLDEQILEVILNKLTTRV